MSWKRGLFRAWLVLSICWIAFFLSTSSYRNFGNDIGKDLFFLGFVFGTPLALLLLGLVLLWIGRGFRR